MTNRPNICLDNIVFTHLNQSIFNQVNKGSINRASFKASRVLSIFFPNTSVFCVIQSSNFVPLSFIYGCYAFWPPYCIWYKLNGSTISASNPPKRMYKSLWVGMFLCHRYASKAAHHRGLCGGAGVRAPTKLWDVHHGLGDMKGALLARGTKTFSNGIKCMRTTIWGKRQGLLTYLKLLNGKNFICWLLFSCVSWNIQPSFSRSAFSHWGLGWVRACPSWLLFFWVSLLVSTRG